jgi:hypothetical protein
VQHGGPGTIAYDSPATSDDDSPASVSGDVSGTQPPASGPGCRWYRGGERTAYRPERQRQTGQLRGLRPEHGVEPPDVSTPTTASCDITYSDESVWQQTVTITFDSQGNPVTDSTNVGTEMSQPTGG